MPDSPNHPTEAQGERRVLTVLFSDLVNWTAFTHTIDAEDSAEILKTMREAWNPIVFKWFGHNIRTYGDGYLAYFGFPKVLERGAHAGIQAALEMVSAFRKLEWPAHLARARSLRTRIGLHSGTVFVGPIVGAGGQLELDAIAGATPNVANRVQTAAAPDSVVISAATYRLIEGQFECRNLGPHTLKGLPEPLVLHEVLAARSISQQWGGQTRPDKLRPLLGRAGELKRLRAQWTAARHGETRVVVVSGDAGIGKSRLIAELTREVHPADGGQVFEFQCSPNHTQASFFPVIRCLTEKVLGLGEAQTGEERIARVRAAAADDPEAGLLLLDFLSLTEPDPAILALPAESRKQRAMEAVVGLFRTHRPELTGLYLFSDVHWADASTLEWARLLARSAPGALLLFSTRTAGPLVAQLGECETIPLQTLGAAEAGALARAVAGDKVLPQEALAHITGSTAGVPLYVEELTRALLAGGALVEHEAHYELAGLSGDWRVPFSLHDLLVARFDRLGPAKAMVQFAAVIGPEFPAAMALELWESGDPAEAAHLLARLVEAEILAPPSEVDLLDPATAHEAGGRYRFRHVLVRNAAYETLLRSTRARHHHRIAERLLATEETARQTAAGLVAQHFTAAEMPAAAAPYWLKAAADSLRHSACVEAAAHARDGLRAVHAVQVAGERAALAGVETMLASTAGTALLATHGFASREVGEAFDHAERVGRGLGASAEQFPVLWGLWIFHLSRGNFTRADEHATEMIEIGRATGDGRLLIEGLWSCGAVRFWRGNLAAASALFEEAIQIYRPEHHQNALAFGQNPGVVARVYLSLVQAFRGRADEAARLSDEALTLARESRHPHSIAWALGGATASRLTTGDVPATLEIGHEAIHYCMEHQHPFWHCTATLMTAWAMLQTGDAQSARRMMEEGFAAYDRIGTRLTQPTFCAMIADACLACGDLVAAESWVDRGLTIAAETGEDLSKPALLLARAQCRLRHNPGAATLAEADLREALLMAHAQGAGIRALQAAASLAHLLALQARAGEALSLLAPFEPMINAQASNPLLAPLAQLLSGLRATAPPNDA